MMFLQVIILLAGFLFLVKGADWFVEGAASIVDHWINQCSNGNQHAGGSSQYYCCNK